MKELKQTEQEIQAFQTEKQRRLNEINIVVTLRLDQIVCLEEDPETKELVLPKDISDCLVFSKRCTRLSRVAMLERQADRQLRPPLGKAGLQSLQGRIAELDNETKELKQQFKDLHKEQNRLAR